MPFPVKRKYCFVIVIWSFYLNELWKLDYIYCVNYVRLTGIDLSLSLSSLSQTILSLTLSPVSYTVFCLSHTLYSPTDSPVSYTLPCLSHILSCAQYFILSLSHTLFHRLSCPSVFTLSVSHTLLSLSLYPVYLTYSPIPHTLSCPSHTLFCHLSPFILQSYPYISLLPHFSPSVGKYTY